MKEKQKDNRDRLAEVARDSVQRSGLKGLSFRTLADEIGIKSSSVHYYFPEKSDLAQVLIDRYSETMSDGLQDIAQRNWSLKRKLSAFIDIFDRVAKNDQLCLCGMMAAEIEYLSDENREGLNRFFRDTEQWLTQVLETHRNDILTKHSPARLAKAMVSGLEGALLLDRVVGNSQRLSAQKELYLSLVK